MQIIRQPEFMDSEYKIIYCLEITNIWYVCVQVHWYKHVSTFGSKNKALSIIQFGR